MEKYKEADIGGDNPLCGSDFDRHLWDCLV